MVFPTDRQVLSDYTNKLTTLFQLSSVETADSTSSCFFKHTVQNKQWPLAMMDLHYITVTFSFHSNKQQKLSFYTIHKEYIQQTNNYSHRIYHTYHKPQPYRQLICNANCNTLFLGE